MQVINEAECRGILRVTKCPASLFVGRRNSLRIWRNSRLRLRMIRCRRVWLGELPQHRVLVDRSFRATSVANKDIIRLKPGHRAAVASPAFRAYQGKLLASDDRHSSSFTNRLWLRSINSGALAWSGVALAKLGLKTSRRASVFPNNSNSRNSKRVDTTISKQSTGTTAPSLRLVYERAHIRQS